MSWFSKSQAEPIRPLDLKSPVCELRRVDPHSKQLLTHILQEESAQELSKYGDWSRVKVESLNTKHMSRLLKQNRTHYTDPDFPHSNSVLCRARFDEEIQWMRVSQIVDNAVYSKQQEGVVPQSIRLNRSALERALLLVCRTSPLLFQELISKTLNSQGFYQFKMFKNGYIQNIVVDDYIPTLNKLPIFVGPLRGNEVYPMLIEKALAKAAGSYEDIPQDPETILEMLFCGPVNATPVSQLKQRETLGEKLQGALEQKQLTVIISRKDPKIRNYGLNEGQVYIVLRHHEIAWMGQQLKELQESRMSFLNQSQIFKPSTFEDKRSRSRGKEQENSLSYSKTGSNVGTSIFGADKRQTEHVYECVSESKLSAWNGRYSLNDQVWGKVDPQKKAYLYSQMGNNKSFLINSLDIGRLFEEVLIFETHSSNNKDWLEHESHNNRPSFTRFQVIHSDNICLRVTAPTKIRQTLILARQTANKQYSYITSAFASLSQTSQLSVAVYPGNYVLATIHEWPSERSGHYHVFLSSHQHIDLQKGMIIDNDFLVKSVLSLEQSRPMSDKENKEECVIRMQLQKLGLAYMMLKPQNSVKKELRVKINQSRLQKQGWEINQPYRGLDQVVVSEGVSRNETLLILSRSQLDLPKKHYFPISAFSIQK